MEDDESDDNIVDMDSNNEMSEDDVEILKKNEDKMPPSKRPLKSNYCFCILLK